MITLTRIRCLIDVYIQNVPGTYYRPSLGMYVRAVKRIRLEMPENTPEIMKIVLLIPTYSKYQRGWMETSSLHIGKGAERRAGGRYIGRQDPLHATQSDDEVPTLACLPSSM